MTTGSLIDLQDKLLLAIAGPEPPFVYDGDYKTYMRADNEGKRRILKNQAKVVISTVPNDEHLRDERRKFLEKIGKSELLRNENWTNERFLDGGARKISLKFLTMKTFLARFPDAEIADKAFEMDQEGRRKAVKVKSNLQDYLNQYEPPDQRILITENITFNELDQIPVYCDVTEKLEDLVIPESGEGSCQGYQNLE